MHGRYGLVPHLRCSMVLVILLPGLTAGPTYCRLFEAGSEVIADLVLRSSGQVSQARSAASA
jgi:hypothetical protein